MEVRNAWIRTPPPGAPTAAGYATITDRGARLGRAGAYCERRTAWAGEMQKHGGFVGTAPAHRRPAGRRLGHGGSSCPDGRHLMLTGLKHPLKAGRRVRVACVQFQRAGDVATDFVVRDRAGGMRM